MKIAILHNFMDNIGGAEYVDLLLARELKADIYTTNFDADKIRRLGFGVDNIKSIGRVPTNAPWRQEAAYWLFRRLDLGRAYDFYIIAGDWAMSGAVRNAPNLWYVYSPTREIWDLYRFTRQHTVSRFMRPAFDAWVGFRRLVNRHDARYPGRVVATSRTVQARIEKYLGRESEIVYPPVDAKRYSYRKNGDFWLSVNRLISHKRVEIQLEAFARMPDEKLVIVGSYERSRHFVAYAERMEAAKPPNVEILNWVDSERLVELYADCKGFITTAQEEDFGLTPLEAMASGKPVIAPNEGGYRETVVSGKNGLLIDAVDADKLCRAVKEIGQDPAAYRADCEAQAGKFDIEVFIRGIKDEIARSL